MPNCAALAETKIGAGNGYKRVICLTIGTGLGCGIVLDGKVLNGAHGGAGEVGHVILYPNGILCSCGRKGCSEQYVSGRALRRLIEQMNVIDPIRFTCYTKSVVPLSNYRPTKCL